MPELVISNNYQLYIYMCADKLVVYLKFKCNQESRGVAISGQLSKS